MTFWQFLDRTLDRMPGWPTERQWVTAALVATMWALLQMAVDNPKLWDVKLFEILLQGIFLTGFLSMVLAFFFSANKGDEERAKADRQKADNTGKLADAFTAVATGQAPPKIDPEPDFTLQPGQTAQAEERP